MATPEAKGKAGGRGGTMERAGGCGGGEQRPRAGGGYGRLLRLAASWPLPRLSDTRGGREHPRENKHNREGKASSVKPSAGLRGPPCSAPCHPACLQLPAPSPRGRQSCQAGSAAQNGELLCCRVGPRRQQRTARCPRAVCGRRTAAFVPES